VGMQTEATKRSALVPDLRTGFRAGLRNDHGATVVRLTDRKPIFPRMFCRGSMDRAARKGHAQSLSSPNRWDSTNAVRSASGVLTAFT
jgi:hypothetical protein